MRRFTSVFGMLLAMVWLPIAMMAAEDSKSFNMAFEPKAEAQVIAQAPFAGDVEMAPISEAKLIDVKPVATSVKSLAKRSKTKAVTTVADLKGDYVMAYTTLTSTVASGGLAVSVEPVEGTDSILIKNFWQKGSNVKAKVDLTAKTITIPNQVVGSNTTYGDYDIAFCLKTGKPDRTQQIEGTISEDGVISITSWWGVYVVSGDSADSFFGVYYNTSLEKANGTMSSNVYSTTTSSTTLESYPVVVVQEAANIIKVKNFANHGQTVEIELKRDSTATIASQLVYLTTTSYGNFSTYAATFKEDYSGLASYTAVITCNKAADKRTISWGNWTMLGTGAYYGIRLDGKIEADFDLVYPALSVTDFQGEGTEANPYLISKLDDLILLSDNVNNNEDATHPISQYSTKKYSRSYEGKYFKVTNDIDMGGYRFDPIGKNQYYRFGGTFDGGNYTIKGLSVNTGSSGYAGLFGMCDTMSVLKNIKLESPEVSVKGYYAGALVAWTLGTIDNVHVSNATVSNTGYTGSAGIVAIADKVLNSSVVNSNITAQYGYGGGVAGQINTLISNSYATNVNIKAGGVGDNYPTGGVVGSLYNGNAENCYFTGTVDGRYTNNLAVGGIAGICYRGSIDKCYSAANVYGYYTGASAAGIVGRLYGSVTNSYSNGFVYSNSSRSTGGITGMVYKYVNAANDSCESVIKNCYSACVVTAETYAYDAETEVRETLGKFDGTAKPVVENVYFDKQMINYMSKNYGPSLTSELTSASGPKGFDSSVWTFTEGYYPRLKGMDNTEAAKYSASTILMTSDASLVNLTKAAAIKTLGNTKVSFLVNNAAATEGNFFKVVGDSLKLKGDFGTDTLVVSNEGVGTRNLVITASPLSFEGQGTESSPYLIKTKADLIELSNATSNVGIGFKETFFKIVNDIDLESDTTFVGIATSDDDAHNYFYGSIDGDGHTIHNMKFVRCFYWTKEPTDSTIGSLTSDGARRYKGFVGRLASTGVLKNLTIAADCQLTDFWASSAPFVANNYGLVENCKNYADVRAYSCWVGGIVGDNFSTGVIRNCYNGGNITTGYMNVGGITGTNSGLVENCENTGDIQAKQISTFQSTKLFAAGGIVGNMSYGRAVNCVNSGTISGKYRVGGISGTLTDGTSSSYEYHNEVINCINYGSVFSDDKINVGSIGGQTGSTGASKDSYYDGQITMFKANGNADLEGVKAITTAELTSGKALDNYSTDIWSFEAGSYPVLKQFANEADVKIQRNIVAKVADGETVLNLMSNVDLGTANGCVWSLKNGSEFKIADNKLVAPETVKKVTVDTLYATVGDIVKPIVIQSTPVVPVSGSGTEADPYLIKTPTDWNAFANFMANCMDDMAGKYVKIENDLDFNADSRIIVPFSNDGVTIFNGNLDGNGKTITATATTTDKQRGLVFASIGGDAYVHDLTVAGTLTAAYAYNGGVIGGVYGTLENVTSNVTVNSTGTVSKNIAGFAGYAYAGAKFINCKNAGVVTSSNAYVAGLVAYSAAGVMYENCGNTGKINYTGTAKASYVAGLIATCFPDTLIGCYNTGAITLTNASSCGTVAGLIAYATASKGGDRYYMKDCYNTADISSAFNNAGLIVTLSSSGYTRIYMDGCYNTGDISTTSTATQSSTYTAGLLSLYPSDSEFHNCWNTGNIISVKPVYAAGLFGYYKGSFSATTGSKIVNCFNSGDINASGNQGGGIIAYCTSYNTVDSCFNVGEITGGFGIGGIAGCFANSVMTNCWNAADVTTVTNRAGGIIGYNTNNQAQIKNCFNVGNITSTGTVAGTGSGASTGVGGIAGQGSGHYTNVYSTGNVSGVNRVGGLIGYSAKGAVNATTGVVTGTSIENAYFCGKVAATDSCGNIVGVNMTVNGKQWNSYNTVKNVYYLDLSKNEAAVDTAGTQITVADLVKLNLGSDWNHIDDYCLPTLAGLDDNAYARLYAAAVVPADGDTYDKITKEFNVGVPEGVVWTTDNSAAVVDGNTIKFTQDYKGKLTITASIGELSRSLTLDCDAKASGVGSLSGNGKVIVNEEFYTTAGVKVAEPDTNGSAVYVVVKTYDDGTTEVVKEVR